MTAAPNVAEAVETTVASHLHPVVSFDLADHPVPTGREEVWRFTPLRRLHGLLDGTPSDAHLTWHTQLPEGVTTSTITAAEVEALGVPGPVDRPSALAVANGDGAVLVDIPANLELAEPLVIDLVGTGGLVYGNVVFRVGTHASATVVLRHTGSAQYASSVSVLVGDGAKLNFVGLQDWADDAVHAGHVGLRIGRDAQVRTVTASLGGNLVRLVETAEYAGPGGQLEQFGVYFVDAGQHIEHRMFVDHNAPNTASHVDYRGALQGEGAHSVWVGDVLIRKVAEGICIESRINDARVAELLVPIHHAPTATALACERAYLARLDGSCRTPIAGYAVVTDGRVDLHGLILTPDGSIAHEGQESGADPEGVGDRLGARLAALAGPGFFSGS